MTVASLIAWVNEGTALFERTVAGMDDAGLEAPSALPGWRRSHVVAHVAYNADALVNLLDWARTGVPTPMYSSPEQRAEDIEKGAALPPGELREKLITANARLGANLAGMPADAWERQVRTAQGRTVPASQVPWMRTREVWVHSADLAAGAGFHDIPQGVLEGLLADAAAKFSTTPDTPRVSLVATGGPGRWEVGTGDSAVQVAGALPDLAAYLLGRPLSGRLEPAGPALPAWL
ncbi:maleylpyruvate isomerase [Microtetraspora sp. NBRC 13810]|uniref:maleylpyruvate isomerase family mycothiol-dependent enzyme n=1 Tax=Microtetraspora sp. NBRC 13810 TaxID=3030990 RepID=UPI0024A16CBD|nr:maleylpyruvate isomerase family mycothiol-dependent enzyme [Microtetraspora sp. NBRC 13810]GLW11108.1 maleylpyruvate isomerase [Microtetraspora sp. NBRC 13810]